jgi:hypothetical protein
MLVTYLEEGLSLRYLFPSSQEGNRVRCEADLKLVGGHWRRTEVCNRTEGTLDSYQRHIKSAHLSATRGSNTRVAVDHIVNIRALKAPFLFLTDILGSVELCR